jgi:hypothetical protein
MFATRLAIIVSLLYTFTAIYEGPIIDPNGGRPRLARHADSDQGPTVDPNGGVHTSAVSGDKGLGVDPNG